MSNRINDDELKKWKKIIRKRDKNRCRFPECNNRKKLQVHHIYPFAKYVSLRYDINNGIVLCKECHKKVTGQENSYISLFTEIVNDRKKKTR